MSYRDLRPQLQPTDLAIVADEIGDDALAAAVKCPRQLLPRYHLWQYGPMRKYEESRIAVARDHARVESFGLCWQRPHRGEVSAVAHPRAVVPA